MKLKIAIPDFSKHTNKLKYNDKTNKVVSVQEDAILSVLKNFNIKPTSIIFTILYFLIGIYVYSEITSALNTEVYGKSVSNMLGLLPLILVGSIILGIIGILSYILKGARGV